MKATDRYDAKFRLLAQNPRVARLPRATGLPRFGHRKFGSWQEFNDWKRAFLLEIARNGGVRWTR